MKALIWIGILLFLIIAVIGVVASQAAKPESSATSQTISFSGTGNHQTNYFTVPDNWTLNYSCTGFDNGIAGAMGVFVYGQGSALESVPVNTSCAVSGTSDSTEMHQGGTIYLQVNATGQWTITIQTHP